MLSWVCFPCTGRLLSPLRPTFYLHGDLKSETGRNSAVPRRAEKCCVDVASLEWGHLKGFASSFRISVPCWVSERNRKLLAQCPRLGEILGYYSDCKRWEILTVQVNLDISMKTFS